MNMQERRKVKFIFAVIVIAAILANGKIFHAQDLLQRSLVWIRDLGSGGVILFIGIYILACVFFLPGSVLTLGAGAIYGVVKGSLIVSAASTLGALSAFLVGRYFARGWVQEKIQGAEKFKAIDEAVA